MKLKALDSCGCTSIKYFIITGNFDIVAMLLIPLLHGWETWLDEYLSVFYV